MSVMGGASAWEARAAKRIRGFSVTKFPRPSTAKTTALLSAGPQLLAPLKTLLARPSWKEVKKRAALM